MKPSEPIWNDDDDEEQREWIRDWAARRQAELMTPEEKAAFSREERREWYWVLAGVLIGLPAWLVVLWARSSLF